MPQAPAAPALDPALEARLVEIDARIAQVTDLRADFEQSRHTPLLREPLASSGRLLVKGERVRWETRRPHETTMTIGESQIKIYYADAAVVEVYDTAGDLRELSGNPLPRLAALRERFAFAPLDPALLGAPEDDENLVGLELTPISEDLGQHVTKVRVVIDAGPPCLSRMEITDADGERTEIRFKNVRINTGVKDSELDLGAPAGVREVRPLGGGDEAPPP